MTARKYNPGFLSDDELVATFCVRTREFASIVETLGECDGNSNTHQIVIGPRGSGKTSLLLRIAAEIDREAGLASHFFPVVFAEESYEVSTVGEFWLECLSRLADRAPQRDDGPDLRRTFEELRTVRDDRMLGDRCLGALQDFADREGKRLVLFVENLNMMFRDMADEDAGWRLRHTLQTEPRIVLLASATSRFDEMDSPDKAFYDLFRVLFLRPLDTGDCATLWQQVSGQSRAPQTIQALRILTGGSPRLLTIVARFGAKLSFRELMADLLNLVDDHTEYFKSHLDALPAQERRVYLALAYLWKPATAREIAERARLDTSKCSAHLARLIDRGAVETTGGTPRRKLYYLTERLYNIYYLMRRARGPAPLIEALIRFMEGYYSADELKEFGARIAKEALEIDGKDLPHYRTAFQQLVRLPSLAAHHDELLSLTPAAFGFGEEGRGYAAAGGHPISARELFENGLALAESGRLQEAVAAWKDLVRRFGESKAADDRNQVSLALVNMGRALKLLNRSEEALAVWDDAAQRFGGNQGPAIPHAVATALVSKAHLHTEENRPLEALVACDEVLLRFREMRIESLQGLLANALIGKGVALMALNRPNEALAACDELLGRFGASEPPALPLEVATAVAGRGSALAALDRLDAAAAAWSQVVERFGNSEVPDVLDQVAMALGNKANTLSQLGRPEEALAACEQVLRRYPDDDRPTRRESTAAALLNKGNALRLLSRPAEAIAAWGECAQRFGSEPNEQVPVALALMSKGMALTQTDRLEEALGVWGDIVQRFGTSDQFQIRAVIIRAFTQMGSLLEHLGRLEQALGVWEEVEQHAGTRDEPEFLELVAGSFVNRGAILVELGRLEKALAVLDRALRQFEGREAPEGVHTVAGALLNKGSVLSMLNRAEEAIAAWSELVRRCGASNEPAILKQVAGALVGKGAALANLGRMEEALAAFDEVLHRFGADAGPAYVEEVSTALSNKVSVLAFLNRSEEALAVCEEGIRRFAPGNDSAATNAFAVCLVMKGDLLARIGRRDEAVPVWKEVLQRFETDDAPGLRHACDAALLGLAGHELRQGNAEAAAKAADRVLQHEEGMPDSQWRALFVRARARLEEGDRAACTLDIEAGLEILLELDILPKEALDALSDIALTFGLAETGELIRKSPASDLLLPLTTAFELELGLEPRVAKEVEEVAEDIRRDMRERRRNQRSR
ncbi:MAG: tetratricopeptide repeat protein [Alphaproteobacteria bacterium]|nr:tetratricopeptide repeat protein [Alphaproteobacteria bacterium]